MEDIVFSCRNSDIRRRDIECMGNGRWMTEDALYWLNMMWCDGHGIGYDKCCPAPDAPIQSWVMSSFAMKKLQDGAHLDVLRWTAKTVPMLLRLDKVPLPPPHSYCHTACAVVFTRDGRLTTCFEHDRSCMQILIFVNESNIHWRFVSVDLKYKKIQGYDSMGTSGDMHIEAIKR